MSRKTLTAAAMVVPLTVALLMARAIVDPPPARAGIVGVLCSAAADVEPLAGTACNLGSKVVGIGSKLLGSDGRAAARVAGLAATAVAVWVGARAALKLAATTISNVTRPQLQSTWFSATYWRVAAVAALLTLPFLFAAAVQALLCGDLSLLVRAALGYLPLAMLAVGVAAPLCTLALAATDEMSALIGTAGLGGGARFLGEIDHFGALTALAGAPFLAIAIGLLMIAGALAVGLELIVREAAVYVVVLMLPLAFAAMVWPARRRIAARMVELLVALILSKFVIVAVLGLAGTALSHLGHGRLETLLAALALLALAVCSPIMLMRLVPLTELAASTGGRRTLLAAGDGAAPALALADGAGALRPWAPTDDWLGAPTASRPPLTPASEEDQGRSDGALTPAQTGPPAAPAASSGADAGSHGAGVAAAPAQRSADGQRSLTAEPWWSDPSAISEQELALDNLTPGAMFTAAAATAALAALEGRQPPSPAEPTPGAQAPPTAEPTPPAPAPPTATAPPAAVEGDVLAGEQR